MTDTRIAGMGSYLPRRMLGNDDLPPLDKPITEAQLARIGVVRRGWADEDEGIGWMAAQAAEQALDEAGIRATDLDFCILANWTQRRFYPDQATRLQALIGAPQAFAFDVGTACAGFAYGVAIAQGFLHGPMGARRGLVVAAETTSKLARPHSKASLVFGDAAGAWVLERDRERGPRLIDVSLATDGRHSESMGVNAEGHVTTDIPQRELQQLAMSSFLGASTAVLERNGLTLDDVDWIVPHSGTAGIQALLLDAFDVPAEKVLTNFRTIGNVSSAAIPTALCEFRDARIQPGDIVLSPTTGSGWYSAALLYRL